MSEKLKLIVLSGLPGAGKSTKARELAQAGDTVVVSRDSVRKFFTFLDEWELTVRMSQLARSHLRTGISVVIDSPNLYKIDEELWTDLASEHDAKLCWIHLDTSVSKCVSRDASRSASIGKLAIQQTAILNSKQMALLANSARASGGARKTLPHVMASAD